MQGGDSDAKSEEKLGDEYLESEGSDFGGLKEADTNGGEETSVRFSVERCWLMGRRVFWTFEWREVALQVKVHLVAKKKVTVALVNTK